MTTRRRIIFALGAGALAASLRSFAQQQKTYRVGILSVGSPASAKSAIEAFVQGLRDLGYVEGKNISIERRFAEGNRDRLPALATELVQLKVDVILATSSFAVQAARQVTSTIPIVMTGVGNPVGSGFVASLSRPGGNITGLSNVSIDVSSKYLELLHAAVPNLSRVALMINPAHPNHPTVLKQVQAGGKLIDVKILPFEVSVISEIERALGAIMRERPSALIVPPDPSFPIKERQIAEFAVKNRLPTMFGFQSAVEAGGLMSYQPNNSDMYHRAAALTDKIFKGTRPGDIPVELPTRFELALNLKTAKALGLTVPQELLLRADKVIE